MTKLDICELMAEKTGFSVKDTKIIVESFLEEVQNSLAAGNHIEIRGFGTFLVKKNKARKARNPKKNEVVNVPAKKKAVLKISRELNKMLN